MPDKVLCFPPSDPAFPPELRHYPSLRLPQSLCLLGNAELLGRKKLAVFSSVACPAGLILAAHDFAGGLQRAPLVVSSGFHAPVEAEVLTVLLRGSVPLLLGVPRGLATMRVKPELRAPLAAGRLLFLSSFENPRRATAEGALYRNRVLAALADAVLVVHAAQGGKTEGFCLELLSWGKRVYSFPHPQNAHLAELGVGLLEPQALLSLLHENA